MYSDYGIYGIYVNGELVYIGKTTRSFYERYKEHKRLIDFPGDSDTQYDMYSDLNVHVYNGDCVQLKPIFCVNSADYKSLYKINNRDIESMEFCLIELYKPKYNICGVKKPYRYTH